MSKSYSEIVKYREELERQDARYYCLAFASGVMYYYATGVPSSGSSDCYEFWNNTEDSHNMHAVAPSVAIWHNGGEGHAAFVEKVDGDIIYYSQANANLDQKIEHGAIDTYNFGHMFSNFKGYVTR